MKKLSASLISFLLISTAGSPVSAEPWAHMGTQAMGMAGAFTAVARGGMAQYWNPAGIAQENNQSGLMIPVTFRAEFTGGLLKDTNRLSNISAKYDAIQSAQTNGGTMDADEIATFMEGVTALNSLNAPGKGLLVDVGAAASIKIGKIALAVHNYTSVGGTPFIDTTNIGLGAISGVGGSGVDYSAAGVDTTISATNVAASDSIEASINTIGFTNMENLMCGAAGCLAAQNAAIVDADSFANVMVDQAEDGGATSAQITDAAALIAENAAVAAPLIGAALSGNSYTNNNSNLTLRGASFTEIALGYAQPLLLPGLLVGGNLKLIQGNIGFHRYEVLDKEVGGSDAFSDFDKSAKKSVQPAIDVGALYDLNKTLPMLPFRPRAGLTIRNLNAPEFDQPDLAKANGEGDKYKLDSQVRLGAAINPTNFWTVAMDVDITENDTPINNFKSRQFGVGTEINIFNRSWLNIPLRAGIRKNLADSLSKIAYTGGFGFNFLHFSLDLSGSVSSETESFTNSSGQTDNVPQNFGVGMQLALLF